MTMTSNRCAINLTDVREALANRHTGRRNINFPTFEAWLAQDLRPKLKYPVVIIMDNAVFHNSLLAEALIDKAGH
jgi:hypothetical protein